MELATNGSLQHLLRQQRTSHRVDDVTDDVDVTSQFKLTSSDLILFAVHVASGMEYVASQRVSNFLAFITLLSVLELSGGGG